MTIHDETRHRCKTIFTSDSYSSNDLCRGDLQVTTSRRELLRDIQATIDLDEKNTKSLLQAFGIGLDSTPPPSKAVQLSTTRLHPEVSQQSFHISDPDISFPHIHVSKQAKLAAVDVPSISSENPFLSTPLRMKYFPKLSPTILRSLLRSPSPRIPTPDDSFSEAPVSNPKAMIGLIPKAETEECNVLYPPTPPMTDKIACRSTFQSPVYTPHTRADRSLKLASPNSIVDNRFDSDNSLLSSPVDSLQSSLAQLAVTDDTPIDFYPSSPGDSSALFMFLPCTSPSQCVADEIKAAGDTPDERQRVLMSLLRSPPHWDSSALKITIPSAVNTPHRAFPSSRVMRSPGFLEIEFAELLEQRAAEEENDAIRLRAMAERLELLARRRRELSSMMAGQGLI